MISMRDLIEPIDQRDIDWVTEIMGLRDIDAPRREFLMSLESLDVSACPGSGKTTLVVAKLAILARKWKSRTRGICVLSHTNVARREIEERLAGTDVGHVLLGYPHHIDTIHGFVNRFLAVPWLLSHGYTVTAIDDDVAAAVRRQLMGKGYFQLERFLKAKYKSVEDLRLTSSDFSDPLASSGFPANRNTQSFKTAATALGESARQGYFRHDEMLLFGEAAIREKAALKGVFAHRFPFVLLDEMQDTSARQANIIDSVLPPSYAVCVQRVGDPNQAIFDEAADVDSSPRFPHPDRRTIGLPNSFRFDDSIAVRAERLAVHGVEPDGLRGTRVPSVDEPADRHVIFAFPDSDPSGVIRAFASHVATVMDAARVDTGTAVAIGEVHRSKEDVRAGHRKFPATVGHYWSGYNPGASMTARPRELVNYVRIARGLMQTGRSSEAVDLIASGIARLANMNGTAPAVRLGPRPHRALERQLANSDTGMAAYRDLLLSSAPGVEDSIIQWAKMVETARVVVGILLGAQPARFSNEEFLRWVAPAESESVGTSAPVSGPNIYQFQVGVRTIDVRMSSIHAAKGETHFATLVLETFNYTHSIKSLLPWLQGERRGVQPGKGGRETGAREMKRLRLNYVALTRATHVVCLALPTGALGLAGEAASARMRLEHHGWRIIDVPSTNG